MADREKLINELANDIAFHCPDMVENGCGVYNCASCLAERLADDGYHKAVQKWIPVTERLPKGGEIVLCNTDYFVEVLQWDERADVWVDQYRSYRKNYVTHWMYLPQPPKGE